MDNNARQWTAMDMRWTTMDNTGQQLTIDNNGQQWTIMDNNMSWYINVKGHGISMSNVMAYQMSNVMAYQCRSCEISVDLVRSW